VQDLGDLAQLRAVLLPRGTLGGRLLRLLGLPCGTLEGLALPLALGLDAARRRAEEPIPALLTSPAPAARLTQTRAAHGAGAVAVLVAGRAMKVAAPAAQGTRRLVVGVAFAAVTRNVSARTG
jgi:hypothetical protein